MKQKDEANKDRSKASLDPLACADVRSLHCLKEFLKLQLSILLVLASMTLDPAVSAAEKLGERTSLAGRTWQSQQNPEDSQGHKV